MGKRPTFRAFRSTQERIQLLDSHTTISVLTQVRHGAVAEPPNPCRFSLGDRRVCTTFRKRLQSFWKTEAELVKQAFLFERRFRDPAEADLASIRRGQYDVGALQSGQQSQPLHRR